MVLDRLRRAARRHRGNAPTLESQPDDLPKAGLFEEPVRVTSLRALDPEPFDDDKQRVTFLAEIRDAEDKRCSDCFVEARVSGPERGRTVSGTTDMLGRIRFRTTGERGEYLIEISNVGAGGLAWDRDAGPVTATTTLG